MKRKIRTLCIITNDYPSENNPVYTFVEQIVTGFADNDINCIVISPLSISNAILRKNKIAPRECIRRTKSGNTIKIYRPRYVSLSNNLFNFNTSKITYEAFKSSVFKEMKKKNIMPDAIYGHFIANSGMAAAELGKYFHIPSFLAYGDCSPNEYLHLKIPFIREKLLNISGVISVSTKNKKELINLNIIDNPKIIGVFPNGIDKSRFYKIDKNNARERLNFPKDFFIVAFVGSFIERKGVHILSQALNEIENVYSIFIGKGPLEPNCKNILFKGTVAHEDLYIYLNAADIFVLPTQAEGCCNAIIEAMACGLPIVSSDQPFNDDILNAENSIRLNVMDKEAIKKAIITLRDNRELLNKMGEASLAFSSSFDINQRAINIIKFMESII